MNNRQRIFLVAALCISASGLPFYFLKFYSVPLFHPLDLLFSSNPPLSPSPDRLIIKLGTKATPQPAKSDPTGGQRPATTNPQAAASNTAGGIPTSPGATDFSVFNHPNQAPTASPHATIFYTPPGEAPLSDEAPTEPSPYATITGIYARPGISPNRARLLGIVVPGLLLGGAIFLLLGWRSAPPGVRHEVSTKAELPQKSPKESKETSRRLMIAAMVVCPYFFAVDPGSVILVLRNKFPRWLTWWFVWFLLSAALHFRLQPA